jgi:NAD(P) transhydrogenase
VIDNERELIEANLAQHGVEVVRGEATLRNAHTVRVYRNDGSEELLTTEIILIATGSSPHHPSQIPFDGRYIYDSDSILSMDRIPKTMAVIGGGVIGSEYASVFTALGAQVTLVDTRDRLLPFVDAEIADRLRQQLERLGLRFFFNAQMLNIEVHGEHVHVQLKDGQPLETDIALMAAGRQSNVQGLGLEVIGVELGKRGLILVNEHYQTRVPNIYAAGDVIGFPALASTSMEQARVAMVHAFNLKYKERVSPILPLAVYTIPEISAVGLSEDECRGKNIPYLAGRAHYETNPRGQIIGDFSGLIKLVFAPADKKLLGVHIIGEQASELIHIGAHVLAAGETIDAFIQAVYNYPTLSDAYKYAAYDGLGAHNRWLAAQ